MMPDSAIPVQDGQTVIEIRPFRGGWQCYEGPGVQPYWTGESAKEDAIGYATARAKFGRDEIWILNNAGEVERAIAYDHSEKPRAIRFAIIFPESISRVLPSESITQTGVMRVIWFNSLMEE